MGQGVGFVVRWDGWAKEWAFPDTAVWSLQWAGNGMCGGVSFNVQVHVQVANIVTPSPSLVSFTRASQLWLVSHDSSKGSSAITGLLQLAHVLVECPLPHYTCM